MTGRLGRNTVLRMLAEKSCDPSGDVDAFMIVLERVKGMIHPVFSHLVAPCFHQRRGVVRGEFGVPLHAEHIGPHMEHRVGAEGGAAE